MIDTERYLERIGYRDTVTLDLATLESLQRAHLTAVPFENLSVFGQTGVRTDLAWSASKLLDRRRGGWCFELNGAFGALLESLGFEVRRLGAAVLLNGPSVLIDHLALEVQLEEPWLVDVGFGESFIRPLALNRGDVQDGGTGHFQFLASPQGTTLARLDDAVPVAQYRFKRVTHQLADFDEASDRLQTDPASPFRDKPFATRLLDGGPDRVTLLRNRLKIDRDGATTEVAVSETEWPAVLNQWFAMTVAPHELPGA